MTNISSIMAVVNEMAAATSSASHPSHPIPQLQGPFEESILESLNRCNADYERVDAVTRRKRLIDGDKYERTIAGRWKQRPGEKFHPLWKIVAQVTFGMHLLAKGTAKSEEEVMKILQTHVDEIDGFVERTTEDFELAQKDIHDRIKLLRVPLENTKTFDTMLEDRDFRRSIVEGNEKIEHIISRSSQAMNDALKDVQKAIDATKGMDKYLAEMSMGWDARSEGLEIVYQAMTGNVEGWHIAFMDLQMKGNGLGVMLVQLGGIVAEMSKRAGVVSRKTTKSPLALPIGNQSLQVKSQNVPVRAKSIASPDKPLPAAPDPTEEAVQATLPARHSSHKARRTSRRVPRQDRADRVDQIKRTSQIRHSKSFPELAHHENQSQAQATNNRRKSLSVKKIPSRKRQSRFFASALPKVPLVPPAPLSPKSIVSRKSSFFGYKSAKKAKAASSGPNPTATVEKSVDLSPPQSIDMPSVELPPGPFTTSAPFSPVSLHSPTVVSELGSETVPTSKVQRRSSVPSNWQPPEQNPEDRKRLSLDTKKRFTSLLRSPSTAVPIVVVGNAEPSTTSMNAPSGSTAEERRPVEEAEEKAGEEEEGEGPVTALPFTPTKESPPNRMLSLSRKTTGRLGSLRKPKQQPNLFPVRSFEHLKSAVEKASSTPASPTSLPRPSSTPPYSDKIAATEAPAGAATESVERMIPIPVTPTDSEHSVSKDSSETSPPGSPESFKTALPPVMLPPRNISKYQTKSTYPTYEIASTELLTQIATPAPQTQAFPRLPIIAHRNGFPNPLRSHAPESRMAATEIMSANDGKAGSPGSAMVPDMYPIIARDFAQESMQARKASSGSMKSFRRIFSRSKVVK